MSNKTLSPQLITLVREYHGLSQPKLAKASGVPQAIISRLETSIPVKDAEKSLERIASVLDFPVSFFYQDFRVYSPALLFRKKASTTLNALRKVEANTNLCRIVYEELATVNEVKNSNIPDLSEFNHTESPSGYAAALRKVWLTPKGPINNLVKLLESNGVVLIPTKFDSEEISGISFYTAYNVPMIFVNTRHNSERQRFTLAHELGHLLMHSKKMISADQMDRIESEADEFASEFLIPSEDFRILSGGRLEITDFMPLKNYWKVSIWTILRKCNDKSILPDWKYKNHMITLSSLGYRRTEPNPIPVEGTTTLKLMFDYYFIDLNFTFADLAQKMHLKEQMLIDIYQTVATDSLHLDKLNMEELDSANGECAVRFLGD